MDKQSSISSSKYISSSLENITLNANISLTQMKEAIKIIDKAAYALIIPILKIQNKIVSEFENLSKECNDSKDKQEVENNENTTNSEESSSDDELNSKNEKLLNFYENAKNNLNIFINISNSEEYENIINNFNELLPDNGMFIEKSGENSNTNNILTQNDNKNTEGEISKILNKMSKENLIPVNHPKKHKKKLKKHLRKINGQSKSGNTNINKKPVINKNNEVNKNSTVKKKTDSSFINKKTAINEILERQAEQTRSHPAPPPQKSQMTRKQKKEVDLLNMIQKDYPTNSYIQRISKTFLSRRLFKNIIYQHIFNYYENGTIDDKKVKTVGEFALYKNCKATFKFMDDNIKNTDKLDEMMGKELKQEFIKLDEDSCEYIIAGRIICTIYEFIHKIFKKNLLKEYSVINATLEFYEFFEELVNEFNEKEQNVRIINCDKITLRHIREDYKNLLICRDYVRKKKMENAI